MMMSRVPATCLKRLLHPRNLPRVAGQQPVPAGIPPEPPVQQLWPREAQGAEDPALPVQPRLLVLPAYPQTQLLLHPGGHSVGRAPGSSPREQLVPEGAGGRPGLGEHLVLRHQVAAASLPASRGLASCRHGLPVQASQQPPGFRLQPGTGPHRRTQAGAGHGGRAIFVLLDAGSAGKAFLSTIQKAAEVVANVVRPGTESLSAQRPLPRGDTYQPAVTPLASHGHPTPGNPLPGAIPGTRAVRHQPGQAGGGWEELDSGPSSRNSSQNSDPSRASDSGSRSGSDSHSKASREPGDLADRAEASSDCQQELSLVRTVTQGPCAFLSREEAQHFIKECGLLNCEAVLALLIHHLGGTSECTQMRALSAIASLGGADLLPQEHILLLSRPRLQELSMGSPGPVTNKATKILRHFEASCGQLPPARRPPAEPGPAASLAGPSDLLADAVPLTGGRVVLQPLSSALLPPLSPDASPLPALGDASGAKTGLAGSREQGARHQQALGGTAIPEGGPSTCPWSRDSLFAGMELVACPRLVGARAAAQVSRLDPQGPRISSQRTAAKEPEPSAFAFLNV
ncbi:AP-4 complex accessory subunit tepsin isoform X3 [Lemur catta]|uniref:AP-4 complex accessory subunit tepsin isoform X3 n=1 Tax=Lemur catta TaxID=9447 RepID=UPI001E2685C9|nr:AP-4 complex accessory subunit tepsin isoform X3 [Lemur catta]